MVTINMAFSLSLAAALGARRVHQGDAPAAAHREALTVKMGTYRVVLQMPGGELPFGLELEAAGFSTVGYLINGQERLLLNEVKIAGSHLEIRMPGYENRAQRRCDREMNCMARSFWSSWTARINIAAACDLGRDVSLFRESRRRQRRCVGPLGGETHR